MKNSLLTILILLNIQVKAQNSEEVQHRSSNFYPPNNSGYVSGDSVQREFYQLNQLNFEALRNTYSALPIDRCHHGRLSMTIYIDSIGQVAFVKLINGTSNKMLDSALIDSTFNFPGKWNCLMQNGSPIGFKGIFAFELYNTLYISKSSRSEGYEVDTRTGGTNHVITHSLTSGYNYHKKCEDAEFFYNQGITEAKKLNYKRAIYNFTNAVSNNPYDLDALYNLALVYLKVDKVKDACECLNNSAEYGDHSVDELIETNCKGVKK